MAAPRPKPGFKSENLGRAASLPSLRNARLGDAGSEGDRPWLKAVTGRRAQRLRRAELQVEGQRFKFGGLLACCAGCLFRSTGIFMPVAAVKVTGTAPDQIFLFEQFVWKLGICCATTISRT